jgi:2-dehydropantoate 2-reductase
MRICIFGAGAVGSHFAVRLARAGHDVSCVMSRPPLEAMQSNGLRDLSRATLEVALRSIMP